MGAMAIGDGKKYNFITMKYPIVRVNKGALAKLNSRCYKNLYRIANTMKFVKDI